MIGKRILFWGLLLSYVTVSIGVLFLWLLGISPGKVNHSSDKVSLATSHTAQAFVLHFVQEYYQWSVDKEEERATRLRPFLLKGMDEQAGIQFSSIRVNAYPESMFIWKIQKQSANQSLITVLVHVAIIPKSSYKFTSHPTVKVIKRWLTVPIRAVDKEQFVVDGIPYTQSPPKPISVSSKSSHLNGQAVTGRMEKSIHRALGYFFKTYAEGSEEQLRYIANVPMNGQKGVIRWLNTDHLRVVKKGAIYWAEGRVRFQEQDTSMIVEYPFIIQLEREKGKWFVQQWKRGGS